MDAQIFSRFYTRRSIFLHIFFQFWKLLKKFWFLGSTTNLFTIFFSIPSQLQRMTKFVWKNRTEKLRELNIFCIETFSDFSPRVLDYWKTVDAPLNKRICHITENLIEIPVVYVAICEARWKVQCKREAARDNRVWMCNGKAEVKSGEIR